MSTRRAFVLSGGANMGCAQVGMLLALFEHDITPDILVGTSVGALNAAAVATNPTLEGVSDLAHLWRSLTSADIFPGGNLSRAWNIARRGTYLVENSGLARVIERATSIRDISDLQLPIRIVACDLATGEEIVLCRGPLKDALLASAALPGVFPPINLDGRVLVDGGVVDAVPIWHALSDDIDEIYVLNVSGGGTLKGLHSPLDVMTRAFAISRNLRFDVELRNAAHDIDVHVLPRPVDKREMYDFNDSSRLLDEAYKLAFAYLDENRLPHVEKKKGFFSRMSF
ncbi:MAG TPA: patatin-like phospholipase family protein [Acidimicrobiia bacterium]|nr:patatin-like phospholipase family protein [Acidimicrobiia bacterium]